MFDLAHRHNAPDSLADAGGVAARGDAHNVNIRYERAADDDHLAFFDPALLGDAVPSLLAEVKARHLRRPRLRLLHDRGLLLPCREDAIRIGLFLCPTLVMSLNTGELTEHHNPASSTVGLPVALATGSTPVAGQDTFNEFFLAAYR